ncbi:MAG: hypothetical protein ACRD8W_23245 [Nitrososphaeraceae archaeon]
MALDSINIFLINLLGIRDSIIDWRSGANKVQVEGMTEEGNQVDQQTKQKLGD